MGSTHPFFPKAKEFVSLCRAARAYLLNADIEVSALQKSIDTMQLIMPKTEEEWRSRWAADVLKRRNLEAMGLEPEDERSTHSEHEAIGILERLIRERKYEAIVAVSDIMRPVRSLAFAKTWEEYRVYFNDVNDELQSGVDAATPSTDLSVHEIRFENRRRYCDDSEWELKEPRARVFITKHWKSLDAFLERMNEEIFGLVDHPDFGQEEWDVSDVGLPPPKSGIETDGSESSDSAIAPVSSHSSLDSLASDIPATEDDAAAPNTISPPSSWSTPASGNIQIPLVPEALSYSTTRGLSFYPCTATWTFEICEMIQNPGLQLAESKCTKEDREKKQAEECVDFFRNLAVKRSGSNTPQSICESTDESEGASECGKSRESEMDASAFDNGGFVLVPVRTIEVSTESDEKP